VRVEKPPLTAVGEVIGIEFEGQVNWALYDWTTTAIRNSAGEWMHVIGQPGTGLHAQEDRQVVALALHRALAHLKAVDTRF
jgi:hypothetical protein